MTGEITDRINPPTPAKGTIIQEPFKNRACFQDQTRQIP